MPGRSFKSTSETGKVLLAFRHLPLEGKHTLAVKAAEAADCAGGQDRFWPMHDELFRRPSALDEQASISKAQHIRPGCSGLSSLPGGRDG